MKTTIRICCALCFFMFCVSLSAQENKAVPQEMLGNWISSVSNPQTGDTMKGTCVIATRDGETRASFDMGYGGVESTPLRLNENGKYVASLQVQDYTFGVNFTWKDDKLSCEMTIEEHVIPIDLKKE